LCGGTHVKNTSDIECFKIIKESAVSQGMRRIEAVSGNIAKEYTDKIEADNKKALEIEAERELEKENEKKQIAEAVALSSSLITKAVVISGKKVIFHEFDGYRSSAIKALHEELIKKVSCINIFVSKHEDKISIIVGISKDIISKELNAGNIVRELAGIIGGKGGGRPDLAEAGCKIERSAYEKDGVSSKLTEKIKELLCKSA